MNRAALLAARPDSEQLFRCPCKIRIVTLVCDLGFQLVDAPSLVAHRRLAELLSDPKLPTGVAETLSEVPLVEIASGYWQRAGELRAKVLAKRRKARLGDALIAQSCSDGGVPLLTRDRDLRAFADAARLDLIRGS